MWKSQFVLTLLPYLKERKHHTQVMHPDFLVMVLQLFHCISQHNRCLMWYAHSPVFICIVFSWVAIQFYCVIAPLQVAALIYLHWLPSQKLDYFYLNVKVIQVSTAYSNFIAAFPKYSLWHILELVFLIAFYMYCYTQYMSIYQNQN